MRIPPVSYTAKAASALQMIAINWALVIRSYALIGLGVGLGVGLGIVMGVIGLGASLTTLGARFVALRLGLGVVVV